MNEGIEEKNRTHSKTIFEAERSHASALSCTCMTSRCFEMVGFEKFN